MQIPFYPYSERILQIKPQPYDGANVHFFFIPTPFFQYFNEYKFKKGSPLGTILFLAHLWRGPLPRFYRLKHWRVVFFLYLCNPLVTKVSATLFIDKQKKRHGNENIKRNKDECIHKNLREWKTTKILVFSPLSFLYNLVKSIGVGLAAFSTSLEGSLILPHMAHNRIFVRNGLSHIICSFWTPEKESTVKKQEFGKSRSSIIKRASFFLTPAKFPFLGSACGCFFVWI